MGSKMLGSKMQVVRLNMNRESEAKLARRIAGKLGKRIKPGVTKLTGIEIHVFHPRKSEIAEFDDDEEGEEE